MSYLPCRPALWYSLRLWGAICRRNRTFYGRSKRLWGALLWGLRNRLFEQFNKKLMIFLEQSTLFLLQAARKSSACSQALCDFSSTCGSATRAGGGEPAVLPSLQIAECTDKGGAQIQEGGYYRKIQDEGG